MSTYMRIFLWECGNVGMWACEDGEYWMPIFDIRWARNGDLAVGGVVGGCVVDWKWENGVCGRVSYSTVQYSTVLTTPCYPPPPSTCLLYTSDAADDMQCVDLGCRRIIKKKKKKNEFFFFKQKTAYFFFSSRRRHTR